VLGQSIKNAADLNALLLSAKDRDVVHIDEAHELAKEYQTALYLAVDKRKLIIQNGKTPMSLPLADFTLLLSTTDEYSLLQPCRDRMKLLLRFQFYEEVDLIEVLRHRSRALRWNVDDVVLPEIAKRAKGTPRLALRLLQSARRCARADGETTITLEHVHWACGLEQIDDLGLGPIETKYLNILTSGATRLNVLASMLGLPSRTVSEVTEPFLLRSGLIIKDDQGRRTLTQKGLDHCRNGVK
jgi:Holliday junction DNA helicase RuvB